MEHSFQNTTRISLLTATFNAGDCLKRTLDSVRNQTAVPDEHIIIDGLSTDDTDDILNEYAESVPYRVKIVSSPPRGVYDALNKGLEIADGDIVGILHANDCLASKDIFEKISCEFRNTDVPVVFGDIRYVDRHGKPQRLYSGKFFTAETLRRGFQPPHPAVFVRKEIYDKYGFFSTQFKVSGDFEWFVRVLLCGNEPSRYIPLLTTEMAPGGISQRWGHRIFLNPKEKLKALRTNGLKARLWQMYLRIFYL